MSVRRASPDYMVVGVVGPSAFINCSTSPYQSCAIRYRSLDVSLSDYNPPFNVVMAENSMITASLDEVDGSTNPLLFIRPILTSTRPT